MTWVWSKHVIFTNNEGKQFESNCRKRVSRHKIKKIWKYLILLISLFILQIVCKHSLAKCAFQSKILLCSIIWAIFDRETKTRCWHKLNWISIIRTSKYHRNRNTYILHVFEYYRVYVWFVQFILKPLSSCICYYTI